MPIINSTAQDAHAQKLSIVLDGSTRGTLTIKGQAVLVLGDGNAQTSTINGDVYLGANGGSDYGILKINGNHVIQGIGGTITMRDYINTKILENDGTGDYLTLQTIEIQECQDWPEDRDCTILVHGSAEIHVGLDNRAYVVSDDTCLKLKSDAKTGSTAGFWVVENDAEFHVETDVTGACAWQILDTDGGSFTIEENLGCVSASGPVTLLAGRLDCYEQLCTTGKLILKSTYTGSAYNQPRIYVAAGKQAKFGLGGASNCSSCN